VPLIGLGQFIIVQTQGSDLNVKKSPSIDASIIGTLENKRDINYSGEFIEGWIKINYYNHEYGDYGKTIEGWVSSKYLNAPNFSSEILSPINTDDNEISQVIIGGVGFVENVDGVIIVDGVPDAFVNLNGKNIKIKLREYDWDKRDVFHEYYNNDLNIKMFIIPVAQGYEGESAEGFLIVNYKGEEELIFINYSAGS
jgi:hypothetical protein